MMFHRSGSRILCIRNAEQVCRRCRGNESRLSRFSSTYIPGTWVTGRANWLRHPTSHRDYKTIFEYAQPTSKPAFSPIQNHPSKSQTSATLRQRPVLRQTQKNLGPRAESLSVCTGTTRFRRPQSFFPSIPLISV